MAKDKNDAIKFSLRIKIAVLVTLLLLGTAISLTYFSINYQQTYTTQLIEKHSKAIAILLKSSATNPLSMLRVDQLRLLLADTTRDENVLYAYVFDESGRILTDGTSENRFRDKLLDDEISIKAIQAETTLVQYGIELLDITEPIYLSAEKIGGIRIGFSLKSVKKEINNIRRHYIIFFLVVTFASVLLTLVFAQTITKAIRTLYEGANSIAAGNFDYKTNIRTKDEIGSLSKSFDEMADDLKQATKNLQDSEEKYKFLAENMADIVWTIDMDFNTTYASPSIEKILGFTPEERKQQKLEDMATPESLEWIMKNYTEELRRVEEYGFDPDRSITIDVEYFHRNGSTVWMENIIKWMRNQEGEIIGIYGASRDITEQKNAQAALWESEKKYQDLYDNAPDMYFSVDAKTAIISQCNQALVKFSGYTKEEIIGRPVFDMYAPDSAEYAKSTLFPAFLKTGTINAEELQLQRKDGSKMDVSLNVSAIRDKKGNILRSRSIWRDITMSKRAEEEIRKLARTDSLTGTNNRRNFMELAESEWTRSRRYSHSLSILMIDIDHFKSINDTYGHHLGDLALQLLTDTCLGVLRENDIFGRIGGEEFAAALVETNGKRGINVAERLRKNLSDLTIKEGSISFNFSISIGVADLNDADESVEDTIKRADKALYKAKSLGRNRVVSASNAF